MKRTLPVIAALLLLAVPAAVQAQFDYTTNTDGTLTITKYTGSAGPLDIPTNISGRMVTVIANNAFLHDGLTSVTFPESITSIGTRAFGSNDLTSVTIPASVTNIGNNPFFVCTNLTNIMVEEGNLDYSSVDGVLFGQGQTALIQYPCGLGGSYTITNTVASIGQGAFYGCASLTNVTMTNSVSSIGLNAFFESGLTSIIIPNSMTNIDEDAFGFCYSLTYVCFEGNYSTNFSSIAFLEDPLTNILYFSGSTGWGATYGNSPVTGVQTYPCAQCGEGASSGDLSVTINPAAASTNGAMWAVNGTNNVSGVILTNLLAGSYTVSFTPIPGWNTPAGQNVTVTNGELTSAVGLYVKEAQIGSLQVTIDPEDAATNGAMWEVDGATNSYESGVTVSNLSAGSHTVSFTTISNWNTPANLDVTITNGENTAATGTYTAIGQPSGALTVTIMPTNVVASNAQWQVNGSNYVSGATVTNLEPGSYTISFTPVSGWNTPDSQIALITNGETTTNIVVYTPVGTASTGSLSVTLLPASAVAAGALWEVDGGSDQSNGVTVTGLSAGNHILSFTPVSGWITPPYQNVTITTNASTKAIGVYLTNDTPTNGLILMTSGDGTIQHSAWPKTGPVVGTKYKVTALPKAKNVFVNWVGGTNPPYSVLSTSASYAFTNQSYLLLLASFETNVFLAAEGTYRGLFGPTNSDRQQTNSGSFLFNVTSTGAFSGTLDLGGQTVPFSGKFPPGGATNITSKATRTEPELAIALQLDFVNQLVSGTVSEGANITQLNGFRDVFSSSVHATNFEGQYTVVIPGTTNPIAGPFGDSYGTVKVTSSGTVTLTGSLADGTAISQSSVVSQDGYWPLYVNLYGGKGSLWGTNFFYGHTITNASALSWINATNSSRTAVYRTGFTNQQAILMGGILPAQPWPADFTATLQQTNPPFTITVTDLLDNTNKLTLKTNKTTGVISGSFAYPGSSKAAIKVNGVILQLPGQTNAAGYFLGTNQSGEFILDPPQ